MAVKNLWLEWMLALCPLVLWTYVPATTAQLCNVTQVHTCYNSILVSLLGELASGPLNVSQLESLCTQHDAESPCQEVMSPCLDHHPELEGMERLYRAVHEDACKDSSMKLLKSSVRLGACSPLSLIVTCLRKEMDKFENSTMDAKSSCDDLRAAVTGCLVTPGEPCQKNQKRPKYSRKTLETLLEMKGCNSNEAKTSVQGTELPPAGSDSNTCSYKQLKRCHEKQINDIRKKMTMILAKGLLPDDDFTMAICRKRRETCYQHNTLAPCSERERNAIRKMEEAMTEAQQLLCNDDRTLLKNLMLSYKWWKVDSFVKCSTDVQENYITDYLYATARIHSDCGRVRARLFYCLNESYSSVDEADPKPDVEGAGKVLLIFLDRMWCVDEQDLPQGFSGGAASGSESDDAVDVDDPTDEPAVTVTETAGSAIPMVSGQTDNGVSSPKTSVHVLLSLAPAVLLFTVLVL
ncbi:uncharacterized protein LOC119172022 [Rhipicephalus microplus]|uniref:uncharacterized protein LOC119172022 n=1 Tax=Rhipicephalus microplus TaxID=6941 RepID=UPI003F6CAC58